MYKGSRLRFSWKPNPNRPGHSQLEAHIARNGRFYGFVAISQCYDPRTNQTIPKRWYLKMLIPGGADHDTNPVDSLVEAKQKARKIVDTVIADMQGVSIL